MNLCLLAHRPARFRFPVDRTKKNDSPPSVRITPENLVSLFATLIFTSNFAYLCNILRTSFDSDHWYDVCGAMLLWHYTAYKIANLSCTARAKRGEFGHFCGLFFWILEVTLLPLRRKHPRFWNNWVQLNRILAVLENIWIRSKRSIPAWIYPSLPTCLSASEVWTLHFTTSSKKKAAGRP